MATSRVEVWHASNLQPLRIGEEKKEEEDRNHSCKIYQVMACPTGQP